MVRSFNCDDVIPAGRGLLSARWSVRAGRGIWAGIIRTLKRFKPFVDRDLGELNSGLLQIHNSTICWSLRFVDKILLPEVRQKNLRAGYANAIPGMCGTNHSQGAVWGKTELFRNLSAPSHGGSKIA